MAIAGAIVAVVGTVLQYKANEEAQAESAAAHEMRARQLEAQATQVEGIGQREAQEEKKAGRLLASRAQAVSAASGAGAMDTTVVNIIADIEGEAAFLAQQAIYDAEEEARNLKYDAAQTRRGLAVERSAYKRQQTSTVLQGAASAYSAYSSYSNQNRAPARQGYG